jgi:hypothetical protein
VKARRWFMETCDEPRITSAEKMDGGVFITFDNGKCALYSASLLHLTFPQADEFNEEYPGEESE